MVNYAYESAGENYDIIRVLGFVRKDERLVVSTCLVDFTSTMGFEGIRIFFPQGS